MAMEWPLMGFFAASAVNIDGLRGISQSRAASHAHTPPTHTHTALDKEPGHRQRRLCSQQTGVKRL